MNNRAADADEADERPAPMPAPIGGVAKTFSMMPRTTFAAAKDIGAPVPAPVEPIEEFDAEEPVDVVDSVVILLLLFIIE